MKIEIEISDLEGIYDADESEAITGDTIKKAIVEIAIQRYVEELYSDYMNDRLYVTIVDQVKDLIKDHQKEIVDSIIEKVSSEIMRKKAIVEQMPRKNEIALINKEWESYFIELIDKAIAKRFK